MDKNICLNCKKDIDTYDYFCNNCNIDLLTSEKLNIILSCINNINNTLNKFKEIINH